MSTRHLSEEQTIEVVELLRLAVESCRTAETLVSAGLERFVGMGADTAQLRHDAARLAAMLSHAPTLAQPASGERP